MRKKAKRKRPYFTMESVMTAILRNASGKMHHGILFAPPLRALKMMFLFTLVFIIFVDMINDKCEVYTLDT